MKEIITKRTIASSWDSIKAYVDNGTISDILSVGDEIEETLTTGEKVVFVVAAIGLYNEKQVIFALKDCLKDEHEMNFDWTNNGGWEASEMRKHLNETVFETLPDELKRIITPRKFSDTCSDTLWLFSEYEIFGETIFSEKEKGDKHMPLYSTERSRVKECGEHGTWFWWERSPCGSGSTRFCYVNSSGGGGANYGYASSTLGVSFGFCV